MSYKIIVRKTSKLYHFCANNHSDEAVLRPMSVKYLNHPVINVQHGLVDFGITMLPLISLHLPIVIANNTRPGLYLIDILECSSIVARLSRH